jgi:hypothetical protein
MKLLIKTIHGEAARWVLVDVSVETIQSLIVKIHHALDIKALDASFYAIEFWSSGEYHSSFEAIDQNNAARGLSDDIEDRNWTLLTDDEFGMLIFGEPKYTATHTVVVSDTGVHWAAQMKHANDPLESDEISRADLETILTKLTKVPA